MMTFEQANLATGTLAKGKDPVKSRTLGAPSFTAFRTMATKDQELTEALLRECSQIRVWDRDLEPEEWAEAVHDTFRWLRNCRPDLLELPLEMWSGIRRNILRSAGRSLSIKSLRRRTLGTGGQLAEICEAPDISSQSSYEAAEARCILDQIRNALLNAGFGSEDVEVALFSQLGQSYGDIADHLEVHFNKPLSSDAVRKRTKRLKAELRELVSAAFDLGLAVAV